MFDPYETYANASSFRIQIGRRLTNLSFEEVLNSYFVLSKRYESVDFDLTRVEWISLFELLLLIQWIHVLSLHNIRIRVFLPYSSVMHGWDESYSGLQSGKVQFTSMYRRQKVSSFLKRINFNREIKRLTGNTPIDIGTTIIPNIDQDEIPSPFDEEKKDPFSARILHLKAFWNEESLNVEGDLSNQQLREMLKEHSCLDPIDSGMLAEVLINELVSNAVQHGIGRDQRENMGQSCAWISARLVKSSKRSIEEVPTWLKRVFTNLLGRHYVEVSICDTGVGIYPALKDHVPQNFESSRLTVKAILDHAFNKFSTSKAKFRTEADILPRGLFSVYDLVRQYGGVLVLRSSGFYMAYDFLTNNRIPRLIDMYDNTGSCVNMNYSDMNYGGTAIQIILPESKGLFLKAVPRDHVSHAIEYPRHYSVAPPKSMIADLDVYTKELAIELENLCRDNEKKPIFVDLTLFDDSNVKHLYVLARIIRYVLYLENPNLLWLVGPRESGILKLINQYLLTGDFQSEESLLPKEQLIAAFRDVKLFDRRICPMLLPSGKVLWIGASEAETIFLKNLWGSGEIDVDESGLGSSEIINLIRANSHIMSYREDKHTGGKIALRIGNYECADYLPDIIDAFVENQIRMTKGVIHLEGCYHLPHGEYSHAYVYLKPLLSQEGVARQMARYLLMKLSLTNRVEDIDIVVGGTHSAKRLIEALADELNAEPLTIDRYTEQIEEPEIVNIVRGKRVLIASDVISTGAFVGSIKTKFSVLGCNVIAICCICDIRFPSRDSLNEPDLLVISLYEYPIENFEEADRKPIYEINPISLSPMLFSAERERLSVPSLIGAEPFMELIEKSDAFIPGHIVLGPTHYTYFIDTKILLEEFGSHLFEIILRDLVTELEERGLTIQDISAYVTAEGSNAELVLPDKFRNIIPNAVWIQLDRIRLTKEGTWQLDKIDPSYADKVKDTVIIILDDGSNTGGTIMQMINAVSELYPKIILGFCIVNRLQPIRSSFLSNIGGMGNCGDIKLKFITDFPIATFIRSNCPICNIASYKVPPDLEEYVLNQKKLYKEYSWNHISAARIRASIVSLLEDKRIKDLKRFLHHVLEVRSRFGIFENRVGVFQEDREELLKLLNDTSKLCAVCFVLNREPHLLESILKFQIRKFENIIIEAILKNITSTMTDRTLETRNMLEFVAAVKPDVAISNLQSIIDSLIITEDDCLAFLQKITARHDLTKIIDHLEKLVEVVEQLPDGFKFKTYLKGLSNRCLSFYRIEKDRASITELLQAILDLKILYTAQGSHEAWKEYGTPLNTISNHINLPDTARKDVSFAGIYRDWREKTVKCIQTSLAPNIYAISKIIEHELGPIERSYFLRDGYLRDNYNLEKSLSMMKDGKFKSLDDNEIAEIEKIIRRLYANLFDSATSPIARTVKKIPVFIKRNIEERLYRHNEWVSNARIKVNLDIPDRDIDGLMTVGSFNKILDYIFDNIKEHNFGISEESKTISDSLRGYEIQIVVRDVKPNVEVIVRSNGPTPHGGQDGQGLRTIRHICKTFDADYKIYNNDLWVENVISMKRWSDDR